MLAYTTTPSRKVFDYTSLDAGTSQYVQQRTGEIRTLMKRTAQDIIEIGHKLIGVKEKLGHGCFLDWIELEFEWSYPTAARFIQVAHSFSKDYQIDKFAPSALYLLAAPSTPATARKEALALAETGENITYSTAKLIKQKHSPSPAQPKSEPVTQPQLSPALIQTPSSDQDKVEVVAIRRQRQVPVAPPLEVAKKKISQAVPNLYIPQPPQPVHKPEQPSICWQLGTRHLLYCADPDSPELLQQLPEKVGLLLAFPLALDWHSAIQSDARIIATQYVPQGKDLRLLEDTLESIILLYSEVGQKVIICFLPFPEILSIVNRLDRRGIFIEPDAKRVHEMTSKWRTLGLKAERVSV